MEDNDIAFFGGEIYNVVILEPTLVYPDGQLRRRRLRRLSTAEVVGHYRVNELMGRWIVQQGYAYSVRTAIWGFHDNAVFSELCQHVDRLFGRYIFRYERFDAETDARAALMADGSIHSVYDADEDRLERMWGMRGHRVTPGGAP